MRNGNAIGWAMILVCAMSGGCSAGARVVRMDQGVGELEVWGPVGRAAAIGRETLIGACTRGYEVDNAGAARGLGRRSEAFAASAGTRDQRRVQFRCQPALTLAHTTHADAGAW